jgi:uncharacterized protein (DUF427 family)
MEKSSTKSHCPYKGDANYFSLRTDKTSARDAVWSYETPFPAANQISEYLAFDSKLVEFVENNTA